MSGRGFLVVTGCVAVLVVAVAAAKVSALYANEQLSEPFGIVRQAGGNVYFSSKQDQADIRISLFDRSGADVELALRSLTNVKDNPSIGLELNCVTINDRIMELVVAIPKLHTIELISADINENSLSLINDVKYLRALTVRRLRGDRDGGSLWKNQAAEHIASLPSIKTVTLDNTGLTDNDLRAILQSKTIQSLELLNNGQFTGEGFSKVAPPQSLTAIKIYNEKLDNPGMLHLSRFKNLRLLYLERCNLDDQGLASTNELVNLETLAIGETSLSGAGLRDIGEIKKLRKLSLKGNELEDSALAGLQNLGELSELYIADAHIGDRALINLAPLRRLRVLTLSCPRISDRGLVPLARLGSLEELSLQGGNLTDACIVELEKCGSLVKLVLINTEINSLSLKRLVNVNKRLKAEVVIYR